MFDRILVVCVGNICRSPMAEAVLRSHYPEKTVRSAGLDALEGEPADATAIALMRERGLDLGQHRGRQLDERLLMQSDLVLVMESGHRKWIEAEWPHAKGRVFRWGHWSNFDVPDPYRRGEREFREVLALIDKGLEDWKERL